MEKSEFKDDGFSRSEIGREKIEFQHPSVFRPAVNPKTEMKTKSLEKSSDLELGEKKSRDDNHPSEKIEFKDEGGGRRER